jgi:hypothetical protein
VSTNPKNASQNKKCSLQLQVKLDGKRRLPTVVWSFKWQLLHMDWLFKFTLELLQPTILSADKGEEHR